MPVSVIVIIVVVIVLIIVVNVVVIVCVTKKKNSGVVSRKADYLRMPSKVLPKAVENVVCKTEPVEVSGIVKV